MRLRHGFIAAFILLAPGCAGRDVMVQRQAELESRLEYLIQMDKALSMRVAEMSGELRELDKRVQTHSASIRELKGAPGGTGSRTKDTPPAANQPAESKIELINADTSARETADSASADYMKAFGLYSTDNYPAAIDSFREFLEKYPDSEYAANARYWIGECYYSQSDMPRALEAFTEAVEKHPTGKKTPDSLLKIGYTLFALKQPRQAEEALALLLEKFPDSPAAAKAREKLDNN